VKSRLQVSQRKRLWATLLVVTVFTVAGALFFSTRNRAPISETLQNADDLGEVTDPRLTYPTPFQNVQPDVKYVGDKKCGGCHEAISASFSRHPMGKSASKASIPSEKHTPPLSFRAGDLRYQIAPRADHVYHQESWVDQQGQTVVQREVEVQFAVGSGQRGVSYLVNQGGFLYMSPITWYPQKQLWDLSPGYATKNLHFGRAIIPECLFCHTNQVTPVADTSNRYKTEASASISLQAIGCERCHGPGELHVKRWTSGLNESDIDYSIVNPRRLEHSLREAVCEQCHLQGEERVVRRGRDSFDFRPGLPLYLFLSDFVKASLDAAPVKFVGTVEQMHASRCYRQSAPDKKLGCISCHDPHALPEPPRKVAYYREKCLSCHRSGDCSLPIEARRKTEDNCIACHMPQTGSDVRHTSITDHSIPRVGSKSPSAEKSSSWPVSGQVPLAHFYASSMGPDDPELLRDLGIALIEMSEKAPDETARGLAKLALPYLDAAAKRDPNDSPAWEAKGSALWLQGNLQEALTTFETIIEKTPRKETTLFLAGTLARRVGKTDAAADYCSRAIATNPTSSAYFRLEAMIHAQRQDWNAAIQSCRRALELEPMNLEVRRLLVGACVRAGRSAEASKEFETLLAMHSPDQQDTLRKWFAKLKA
jgi:tetratricopeptide (TPR) repeat protein